MAHVSYHEFNHVITAENATDADAAAREVLNGMRYSASPAYTLYRQARLAAHYGWATDRDPAQLAERLRLLVGAGLAVFEGAANPEGTVRHALLDGGAIEVPSRVDPDLAETDMWIECAHAALLLRRRDELQRLSRAIPSGPRVPPAPDYQRTYARALARLGLDNLIDGALLVEAMEQTDPKGLPPQTKELALTIYVPDIMLAHLVGLHDVARANDLVAEWAGRRRKFFDRAERRMDPLAFLALGQAAHCAVGRDLGMQIVAEADDLPAELIASGGV